jgi:hypothetical protein
VLGWMIQQWKRRQQKLRLQTKGNVLQSGWQTILHSRTLNLTLLRSRRKFPSFECPSKFRRELWVVICLELPIMNQGKVIFDFIVWICVR